AQLHRLASLPLAERRQLPGLEPERAPVIVAGGGVIEEGLRRYGLDGLEGSEGDLLHGAPLAAAGLAEPEEGGAPPRRDTRRVSTRVRPRYNDPRTMGFRRNRLVLATLVIAVLIALAFGAAYAYARSHDDVIADGVHIGALDVGGLSTS